MRDSNDILKLVQKKETQLLHKAQRALIIQPGAIGDCILTLPLAKFMKESLGLGSVDILGNVEYIGMLPARTIVDSVRSMETVDLHRLFAEPKAFHLPDRDPLISFFSQYSWIVTFLGEPGGSFEKNLIFTVYCGRSAEVVSLALKPPEGFEGHLAEFHIKELVGQAGLVVKVRPYKVSEQLINSSDADTNKGRELLQDANVDLSKKLVVIHPGSGGKSKCWHLENFLAVARKLAAKNIEVVFLLGPAEQERFDKSAINEINKTGKCISNLPLPEVVGLLSWAWAFAGNDSGITHLAAGMGIETIAIFGPSNPNIYRPVGPKVTILRGEPHTFATEPSEEMQQQLLKQLETAQSPKFNC